MEQFLFILLFLLSPLSAEQAKYPIVTIGEGRIQGELVTSNANFLTNYYAFKGIPYASPPVGNLRFKPPQRPKSWDGIKLTQKYGNICPQVDSKNISRTLGHEDCLTLNVFTKQLSSDTNSLRAVIFWIHGGFFVFGSPNKFGPDYFIEHDVVVVTTNYRLGVLGFLSVNDENAPGNVGLKDQIAALSWVKHNIQHFGGNPDRVTIYGHSAGAKSVEYIQLSSLSKGLFNQVIMESGSALGNQALQREPLRYAYALASSFFVNTSSTQSLIKGLQTVDYRNLVLQSENLTAIDLETLHNNSISPYVFVPTIETNSSQSIITSSVYELLETGNYNQVPYILGHNTYDGSSCFHLFSRSGINISLYNSHSELFVSPSLNCPVNSSIVGNIIRNYYIKEESVENSDGFARYLTDETYVRGIRKSLQFRKNRNVSGYFFRFSHMDSSVISSAGVPHGGEVKYIWYLDKYSNWNWTAKDVFIRNKLVNMLTNFVKLGNPTPNADIGVYWPKVLPEKVWYLEIGEEFSVSVYNDSDFDFWESTFKKYGIKPFVTY